MRKNEGHCSRQRQGRALLVSGSWSAVTFIGVGNLLVWYWLAKQTLGDQIAIAEPIAITVSVAVLCYCIQPWMPLRIAIASKTLSFKAWVLTTCLALMLSVTVHYWGTLLAIDTHFWERSLLTSTHYRGLLILTMVMAAPLFEELLFRGCFFTGLLQLDVNRYLTILITALFWTFLHWQYALPERAVLFLMGLIFGILRLQTGSLLAPWWCHVVFNGSQLIL